MPLSLFSGEIALQSADIKKKKPDTTRKDSVGIRKGKDNNKPQKSPLQVTRYVKEGVDYTLSCIHKLETIQLETMLGSVICPRLGQNSQA